MSSAPRGPVNLPAQKTKIVGTIGPATSSPEVMQRLIEAGLNVARLNFSHGDFESHRSAVQNLRAAAAAVGRDIAIMADLPGPKIRIGKLETEPIELQAGESFTLTTEEIVGNRQRASMSFLRLPEVVKPGDELYLNDGIIRLVVKEVAPGEVRCRIAVGGELRARKGLNLPGIDLGASAFTARDRECLEFALENGVDAVSQSFVDSAADVVAVRQAARELGFAPFIIAKVERARALERIDEILDAADGMMIARGDLGVEVPIERIAVIQKQLMWEAVKRAKPVITATQMLESMTASRQPTRAEATDVANAILDGTDCVMLSAESATGRYPVDAVETLARIAAYTESHRTSNAILNELRQRPREREYDTRDLAALSLEATLSITPAVAVVAPTDRGATARSIARFRLPVWVAAISSNLATARHLHFSYGISPRHHAAPIENWDAFARGWVEEHGLSGKLALLVQGPSPRHPEINRRIEFLDLDR